MVAPGSALPDALGAIDVAVGAVRTDAPAQGAGAAGMERSPCAKVDAQFGGRWKSDPDDTAPRVGEAGDGVEGGRS